MRLAAVKSKMVNKVRSLVARSVEAKVYDALLLQGRMASWHVRQMKSIRSLSDVEFKVFSQWGEDGIIDWLIERAAIPPPLHSFVEIGVETYVEANTRFLIENRNWRGLIIDGYPDLERRIMKDDRYYRYEISAKSAFVVRENINSLIAEAGFGGEIGLLSLDIDGNDYWIWEAMDAVRPIIFVCEYNAAFGDMHPVSVPYAPQFVCGENGSSRLYFGASIAAFSSLAARKGYRLLGTTMVGNDAFFIREDYFPRFEGALANIVAMPSKFRVHTDPTGEQPWIAGYDRFRTVADLPLIHTETGATVTLGKLGSAYSEDWLQQTAGRPTT